MKSGPSGNKYLVVGAPGEVVNGIKSGFVTVFRWTSSNTLVFWDSANNSGFTGGAAAGDELGTSLACGDMNNDGVTDLAVGAPGTAGDKGHVYLFRGDTGGLTPQQRLQHSSPVGGDRFGTDVAVGNMDGLGAKELAVGAPGRSNNAGRVFTFKDSSTAGITMQSIEILGVTTDPGDFYGMAVNLTDLNGDGREDLIAGAPGGMFQGGKVRVYNAVSNGTMDLVGLLQEGGVMGQFGQSLAVGDFDNDGVREPVVGAPGVASGVGMIYEFWQFLLVRRSFDQESATWR
jgi:hypothetical protein